MRGRSSSKVLSALCVTAVVTGTSLTQAHQPFFGHGTHFSPDSAFALPDTEVSRAVYIEAACPSRPFWTSFSGQKAQNIYVEMGIPKLEALVAYRPTLYLVGPALPDETNPPFAIPSGLGLKAFPTDGVKNPKVFNERFTNTDSWILLETTMTLPAAGRYYLVAHSAREEQGRLWLSVGVQERREPSNVDDPIGRVRWFHDPTTAPPGLGARCHRQ